MMSVWPLLLIAGFLLATAVLSVLASYQRYALHLHNTIRQSRIKRFEYLASLEEDEVEPQVVRQDA